jgi:exodeoxyribonuclease (lambda-induced)
MHFIECIQGTPEWLAARAGCITASNFSTAISTLTRASGEKKAGDPTDAADKYAGTVALERISRRPYGEPVKSWVLDRGHELETVARVRWEARMGLLAEEAGICKTDDDWFGYSTDGLVDNDGLIEIKCPIDPNKIAAMFKTGDVSEYIHQIQGGLWITGRQWCDFIMFVPDLESVGNDLYVKRIYRDDDFIDAMEVQLLKFRSIVNMRESLFRMPISSNAAQIKVDC